MRNVVMLVFLIWDIFLWFFGVFVILYFFVVFYSEEKFEWGGED